MTEIPTCYIIRCPNEAVFLGRWLIPPNHSGAGGYGAWEERPVCADHAGADAPDPPLRVKPLAEREEGRREERKAKAKAYKEQLQRPENRLPGTVT